MTEQYQEQDINGQPSPLSLTLQPTGPMAAGVVDDAAIFFTSGPADAVIVGEGLVLGGDANVGTIIFVRAPGVYDVKFSSFNTAILVPPIFNLIRDPTLVPVNAANGYPAPDFATFSGVTIDVGLQNSGIAPGGIFNIFATMRVTNAQISNVPFGGPQIRISAAGASIPTLLPPATLLTVERVSR